MSFRDNFPMDEHGNRPDFPPFNEEPDDALLVPQVNAEQPPSFQGQAGDQDWHGWALSKLQDALPLDDVAMATSLHTEMFVSDNGGVPLGFNDPGTASSHDGNAASSTGVHDAAGEVGADSSLSALMRLHQALITALDSLDELSAAMLDALQTSLLTALLLSESGGVNGSGTASSHDANAASSTGVHGAAGEVGTDSRPFSRGAETVTYQRDQLLNTLLEDTLPTMLDDHGKVKDEVLVQLLDLAMQPQLNQKRSLRKLVGDLVDKNCAKIEFPEVGLVRWKERNDEKDLTISGAKKRVRENRRNYRDNILAACLETFAVRLIDAMRTMPHILQQYIRSILVPSRQAEPQSGAAEYQASEGPQHAQGSADHQAASELNNNVISSASFT